MKYSLILCILLLSSCSQASAPVEAPQNMPTMPPTIESHFASIPSPEVFSGFLTTLSGSALTGTSLPTTLSGVSVSYTGEKTPIKNRCMQDVCIDTQFPYFEDADTWVQIFGEDSVTQKIQYLESNPGKESGQYVTGFSSGQIIQIKKDYTQSSREVLEEMGGNGVTYIKPNSKVIVKLYHSNGCFRTYKEEFFDMSGKKIANPSALIDAPEKIDIGNIILTADWSLASEFIFFGAKFGGRDVPFRFDPVSLKSDYKSDIVSQLKQLSSNGTFGWYVLEFVEIPGVLFYYKSNLAASEGVITIQLDAGDMDTNGDIISETKTRDILRFYSNETGERKLWRNMRLKGDQDDYAGVTLDTFLPEMLPIFRVVHLEGDSYLLYPASLYEGFTSAELCKPLVYVYDSHERANSLRVDFPHGGSFTRIIPDFSSSNIWDFSADSSGEITLRDMKQSFGYLYYSAKVPNYTYNTQGWQVYGKDIVLFFDEKLDTIGFNEQEKKDFIEYWREEFDSETLYFVSFKFDEMLDEYVTLEFTHKPIRQMRVLLEAYPLKEKNTRFLWPTVGTRFDEVLLRRFIRSGEFDVFEWGGTVQKIPNGEIIIH